MMQMRTHTCNQLRLADVGKSVKIVGWMENVREVGSNLAFVVLRDSTAPPRWWPRPRICWPLSRG